MPEIIGYAGAQGKRATPLPLERGAADHRMESELIFLSDLTIAFAPAV